MIDARTCICCGSKIEPIRGPLNEFPWKGMWKDGVVDRISANYGSELDGNMYVITVCDTCIRDKSEKGIIEYAGNYMG